MGARSGEQFLQGLRRTKRQLWLEGERVDDVTTHPALAGGAQTLAGVFDRLRAFPDECLTPDPETGEPLNVGHMIPRSVDDLKRRNRGLARIAEATVGLMGRTPDYMNVKFASFAGRWKDWLGADGRNEEGAHNLVAFQKRLARQDISLTHTIIHPTIDKSTDAQILGNRVPLHKIGENQAGIVVRGARILATLAPFADEIAVYPAFPLPAGAEAYALAFSIPVDTPGLLFLCRDSVATPGAQVFDRPLSTRFDEQDAFVIFDDVEIPRERLFIDGSIDLYNTVGTTGLRDNLTNQTTIRALTKLEFAYGLATRMAEADRRREPGHAGDAGRTARLRRGHPERRPALCRARPGRAATGCASPTGAPSTPCARCWPTWFPRVNEIIMLIGSHNLLATPSRRQLDDATLRPLIDEFLHGAKGIDAEERAALFRLAWDFVGSSLAGRNVLYERFYLTSAARNRIIHHVRNVDRSRAYALVDGILAAGRKAGRLGT